ncbi:MAG: hypothetical protein FK734_18505, partial [Asgard group archaeon]|nr:hypothetical protein [Asgard group archaeon]
MNTKNRRCSLISVILMLIIISSFVPSDRFIPVKTIDPFFTLVAKTNDSGARPDYLNFMKQQLAQIGINVDVIIQDWATFVGELIAFRDFDLCYVALTGGGLDPDMTGIYNENGSLNLFGYNTDMDYDVTLGTGINEWYMREGNLIMPPDSEERIQHYWEWEQYLMDKICPMLPAFAPQSYAAYWSNLIGFNFNDKILQSWGKMYWDGSHTGQTSTDELVTTDAAWSDLNPLFQADDPSSSISNAVMDPLIWYDADLSVWPHLAESYTMINATHLRITCRQGIKWDIDPDGIFTNEYLDIRDVYFTFYIWSHVSNDQQEFQWIKDMEILDQWTLDIFIDGDPSTQANDPYAPFLPSISLRILPEHYLNQTQLPDGVTPDISHPSWNKFATNCFGTGLFEISDFTEGVETILSLRTDCWWLDETITSDPDLNWENRFGFDTTWDANGMDTWRVRILTDYPTIMLEFEAGYVDIMGLTYDADQINEYLLDPNFNIQSGTQSSLGFFGYNMREVRDYIGDSSPCADNPTITKGLAIRKAISYAIDREEINDVIHSGDNFISYW